jgi:hypothetical protein
MIRFHRSSIGRATTSGNTGVSQTALILLFGFVAPRTKQCGQASAVPRFATPSASSFGSLSRGTGRGTGPAAPVVGVALALLLDEKKVARRSNLWLDNQNIFVRNGKPLGKCNRLLKESKRLRKTVLAASEPRFQGGARIVGNTGTLKIQVATCERGHENDEI